MTDLETDTMGITTKYCPRQRATAIIILAFLSVTFTGGALDFPRLANLLNLSEKASEEMREEERVSEVLNQDADYRQYFQTIHNPDIPLQRYVRPGEELKFQAKWRGLPAGSIRLTTKRVAKIKNRPVFVFELNVETNDFLSSLYPVTTSINSYVDAGNGRSYLIRRRVSERTRFYKDRLEFKYDFRLPNGITDPVSKYSFVGENGQEIASQHFPIPGNMQDMVSIIYYIRGMELNKIGDTCSMLIGGRKKPVITTLTVIDEEQLTVPDVGTFDCLVVEPHTDGTNLSGNFVATRGGERVWLEKNTRIPVMVSAVLPIGSISASLIQANNSDLMQHVIQ